MNERDQLLRSIGVVSFTMVDLALYLDTHPTDRKALEYYNHYVKIKRKLSAEFAQKFFPLTLSDVNCDNSWTWGEAPLPWEGGCA